MPTTSAARLVASPETYALPPVTWRHIVEAIRALDPASAAVLGMHSDERQSRELSTQREERDAVLLSLELAGLARPHVELPLEPGVHFLEGAEATALLEEHLVDHDALAGLPGWWRDIDPPRSYGFRDHLGRRLTVTNVGGDRPERVTGVDLIYWRAAPNAFVLVQYKRLAREAGSWRYRPSADSNFSKEVDRMQGVLAELAKLPNADGHLDFRLMANPFFFKFCSPIQPDRRPGELMAGMYVPLAFWERLSRSGVLAGPRGGISIGYDNAQRWLSNTLFAELVSGAWLGTAGRASEYVAELIRSSLGLGRSVVVAVEHPRN
jgi:hypothetical protein